MEGADLAGGALGEAGEARFGDVDRTTGAVGGKRGDSARTDEAFHGNEGLGSSTGRGASDDGEAEPLNGAGDEFAVKTLGDDDDESLIAEAIGGHQQ